MTTSLTRVPVAPAPTRREIEDALSAAGMVPSILQLQPHARGYAAHARCAGYEVQATLPILVLFHGFSPTNQATGLRCIRQALSARYDLEACVGPDNVGYYAIRGRKGGAL